MLNKFNLQFGSLLFGSLLMLGCSGGGSGGDDNVSAAPDPDDVTVNGAAVKGPLIGADINAYIISPAEDGMRGRLIASGTTDANARLAGIEINTRRLDKAFLLEISGGADHTTVADSLISPLSTVITAEGLANG